MVNDVLQDSVESAKYDVKKFTSTYSFWTFFMDPDPASGKKVKSGQKDLDPKH